MNYKFSKGIKKGIITALTVLATFMAFSGFADISVWQLMTTYIQPILGAMTVGGAITIALNYLKIKWIK